MSMKTTKILIVLPIIIASLNLHAAMGFPGGSHGSNSGIDIEKIKQQIKNDKSGLQKKKSDPVLDIFGGGNVNTEHDLEIFELAEKLELKLKNDDLVKYYDRQTLDKVLSFAAMAFQAWNPELKETSVKTQIVRNIVNFGFKKGFVSPIMSLIDVSYATGKPQFGNLLNVMMKEISPKVADQLEANYNLPTSINGANFLQLSGHGRQYMWDVLLSQLGHDFSKVHNQKLTTEKKLNDLINPMKHSDESMDHFTENTVRSKNSFLDYYLKTIGHQSMQHISDGAISPEQKKMNAEKFEKRRGLFTDTLASQSNSCYSKCMDEMTENIIDYGTYGNAVGRVAGAVVGKLLKVGGKSGADIGGKVGAAIGTTAGTAVGVYECSKACSDKSSQEKKEKEAKEQKEKEIKEYKQNLKKEQDETRAQQDEIKKQQEKYKSDIKKQEELKQKQIELEKKQAELKKKEEELKIKEGQEKEEDEKEKQVNENTEDQKVENSEKPKQDDEEGSGLTIEEQQKIKKSSTSTPMAPKDDFVTISGSPLSKYDYIKVMDKDVYEAPEKKPILVYPKNPNSLD